MWGSDVSPARVTELQRSRCGTNAHHMGRMDNLWIMEREGSLVIPTCRFCVCDPSLWAATSHRNEVAMCATGVRVGSRIVVDFGCVVQRDTAILFCTVIPPPPPCSNLYTPSGYHSLFSDLLAYIRPLLLGPVVRLGNKNHKIQQAQLGCSPGLELALIPSAPTNSSPTQPPSCSLSPTVFETCGNYT